MEGMALNNEIYKAIFILETALTTSKTSDIMIGDIAIPRQDVEELKQKFELFQKDGQVEKIFKAIPLELSIGIKFWRELQILIREVY